MNTKAQALRRPRLQRSSVVASIALLPAVLAFLMVYVGCATWSIYTSMTASRMLPSSKLVGLKQYSMLFNDERWQSGLWNITIFGPLTIGLSLVLGIVMAILIDQKIRGEDLFRSIFLYPYAMSFIVTGFAWRWLLDPTFGVQSLFNAVGLSFVHADWLINQRTVIFTLVAAAVWHGSGLVMTIMLAGLRGIDEDLWKATRVEAIPKWRVYLQIILPMLGAQIVTAALLLSISVVKVYDLVIAMTNGGPGFASDMPAKVVMDAMFERQNIALGTAGATIMLITVASVLVPLFFWQSRKK